MWWRLPTCPKQHDDKDETPGSASTHARYPGMTTPMKSLEVSADVPLPSTSHPGWHRRRSQGIRRPPPAPAQDAYCPRIPRAVTGGPQTRPKHSSRPSHQAFSTSLAAGYTTAQRPAPLGGGAHHLLGVALQASWASLRPHHNHAAPTVATGRHPHLPPPTAPDEGVMRPGVGAKHRTCLATRTPPNP